MKPVVQISLDLTNIDEALDTAALGEQPGDSAIGDPDGKAGCSCGTPAAGGVLTALAADKPVTAATSAAGSAAPGALENGLRGTGPGVAVAI